MYAPAIPVDIGYCLVEEDAGFAFTPPRSVFAGRTKPLGMRAIQNCPAVNGLERQLIELCSPIALKLSQDTRGGKLGLQIDQKATHARPEMVRKIMAVEPPERWRHPKKPVIQIRLPYFLVTDEPCWVNIVPPFLGPNPRRWPGTMVAGRYPISDWPQNINWAIEWDQPEQELTIRQGDVLAYALFDFDDPNKRPNLVEAEMTPELEEYRAGMDGVRHITSEIEEVWAEARERRPARLLHSLEEPAAP